MKLGRFSNIYINFAVKSKRSNYTEWHLKKKNQPSKRCFKLTNIAL